MHAGAARTLATREARRRSGLREARGFTVLELVVTLGLLALLVVLARPGVGGDPTDPDAAAQHLRAVVQQAQRTAVIQRHDVLLSVDTVGHRVRIVEDRNNDHALNAGERATWHRLADASRFSTPPARIRGASATAAIWGNRVIDRDGFPSVVLGRGGPPGSDLEMYLQSRRGDGVSHRAIALDAATGRTHWYRYDPLGTWQPGSADR